MNSTAPGNQPRATASWATCNTSAVFTGIRIPVDQGSFPQVSGRFPVRLSAGGRMRHDPVVPAGPGGTAGAHLSTYAATILLSRPGQIAAGPAGHRELDLLIAPRALALAPPHLPG